MMPCAACVPLCTGRACGLPLTIGQCCDCLHWPAPYPPLAPAELSPAEREFYERLKTEASAEFRVGAGQVVAVARAQLGSGLCGCEGAGLVAALQRAVETSGQRCG